MFYYLFMHPAGCMNNDHLEIISAQLETNNNQLEINGNQLEIN